MGKYVGIVRRLPSGASFGTIKSDELGPLVPFDEAAFRAAGRITEGSYVTFNVGGRGAAVGIKPSGVKNYLAMTRGKNFRRPRHFV